MGGWNGLSPPGTIWATVFAVTAASAARDGNDVDCGMFAPKQFTVRRATSLGWTCARPVRIFASTMFVLAFGFVPSPAADVKGIDPAKLPPAASRQVDFTTDIQPIFQTHCLKCHGPDKQRGGLRLDDKEAALKGGEEHAPAIEPGNSAGSPLVRFVAGADPDLKMPPKDETLSAEQIGLLRAWIDQGAIWPDSGAPRETHWAFKPIKRPPIPATKRETKLSNLIDGFISAKLAEKKLSLSPEADRRTVLRRVYFDLTGLPPTPEEVSAFENDRSPDAYERVVEKLLASPRYGERWARHWFDVVRFAETSGFEVNTPRANAWPYRDYVIRAFNEDIPYDRFVMEQIAGDVLGVDAATGFLVAGPDDLVKSPDPVLTSNQRADELHDIVSTTASTFLGLTVGCARCHNHKFDPIPQIDYFAMKAVFEGVRHGERRMRTADAEAREKELAQRRERLAEIDAKLADFEPLARVEAIDTNALRAAVNARKNTERFAGTRARWLRFTVNKTSSAEPCIDELEVYTAGDGARNIALASAGTKARASSVYPNSEIHRLEHINDGKHGNSRSWISNERGKGWVELEFPEIVTIDRIIWGRDREQKFADRLATDYRIEVAVASNEWRVVVSSADRQPYKAGAKEQPAVSVAGLDSAQAALVKKLVTERKEHEARIAELSRAALIYGGTFAEKPGATHRFHRGDPMQKREVIPPGALEVVPVKYQARASVPDNGKKLTEEQQRRIALARWMVDPANPLTARVMVNRLWQYHFGEGLVSTPSDFGANGARPTHPELLDWLAAEFMGGERGEGRGVKGEAEAGTSTRSRPWSIKHIHKLIVMSATYRQASDAREEGMAVDAGSRLLWRYPPRRLEAEPIRDMILSVSGKLDLTMGGRGFSFFEPNDNYVRVYAPKKEFGPETFRRMVYGTVVRQRPDGVFGVFDCPDGGQIAPRRTRSTTPLQALNLLNSGFMMQQSAFFADRLKKEAGGDATAQARRAFALAFQRQPDAAEVTAATELIRAQSLPVFCRALLNANEFVYLF
jgi:mono/diheme cytochrome c family protein